MDDRGFTLVELMVVIIVVSILTAVMVPQFTGTHEEELLRAAGRDLVGAMKYASSQAVTRHQVHRLHIDPRKGAFWLEAETRFRDFERISEGAGRMDERITVFVRSSRAVLETGTSEIPPPLPEEGDPVPPEVIRFRADGTADGREIELRDRSGFGLRLVVNPVTSRILLIRLDREVRS